MSFPIRQLFYDLDTDIWLDAIGGDEVTEPLKFIIRENIPFAVRFQSGGVNVTVGSSPTWKFIIKSRGDYAGSNVVYTTTGAASDSNKLYTFTPDLNSTELNAALGARAILNSALEIDFTVSGVTEKTVALPTVIYNDYAQNAGTTTSANGTLDIAAGKTVTFPLSLTFPSAAGTDGYHLSLLSAAAGTTEWVPDAAGTGTVTTVSVTTANGISGTVVNATTTPAITLALGAITPSSVNGNTIADGTGTLTLGSRTINLTSNTSAGGSITMAGGSSATSAAGSLLTTGGSATFTTGGNILTYGGTSAAASGGGFSSYGGTLPGGSIQTYDGGGSITTRGTGTIQLGSLGTRTTILGTASADRTITIPDNSGTLITTGSTGTVTNAMLAGSIDLTAKVTGALPASNGGTGLTALGTGVATALAVNVGNTGAFTIAATSGTDGAVMTSAQTLTSGQQAQVRANVGLNISKAASAQVYTNDTLADYDRLTLTLAANSTYKFEWEIHMSCDSGGPGMQFAMTFPASVMLDMAWLAMKTSGGTQEVIGSSIYDYEALLGSGTQVGALPDGVAWDSARLKFFGVITTATITPGDALKLQFAQSAAHADDITIRDSSTLTWTKLS